MFSKASINEYCKIDILKIKYMCSVIKKSCGVLIYVFLCVMAIGCASQHEVAHLGKAKKATFVFSPIYDEERELCKQFNLPVQEVFKVAHNTPLLKVILLAPFNTNTDITYSEAIISGIKAAIATKDQEEAVSLQIIPIDTGLTVTSMENAIERLDRYSNISAIIGPLGIKQTAMLYNAIAERNIPILSLTYDASLKNKHNLYLFGDDIDHRVEYIVNSWRNLECDIKNTGMYAKKCLVYAILPNARSTNTIIDGYKEIQEGKIQVAQYNNDHTQKTLWNITDAVREIEGLVTKTKACSSSTEIKPTKIAFIFHTKGWELKKIYYQITASPVLAKCKVSFLGISPLGVNEAFAKGMLIAQPSNAKYSETALNALHEIQKRHSTFSAAYEALMVAKNALYFDEGTWRMPRQAVYPFIINGIGMVNIMRDGSICRSVVINNVNSDQE